MAPTRGEETMSKFDDLVRARIAKTGESWSTASGHVADERRKAAKERKATNAPAPNVPFESEPFVYDGGTLEPRGGGGFFVFDGTSPNAMGPFLRVRCRLRGGGL